MPLGSLTISNQAIFE